MIYNEVNLVNHNSGWRGLIKIIMKEKLKIKIDLKLFDLVDQINFGQL